MNTTSRQPPPPTYMSITAEDISLYDRQIRLWGLEGQARLHNARVLVLGAGAVATEVLKNIILAGIGKVTVNDNNIVKDDEVKQSFLLSESDIGKNRGSAVSAAVNKLNARVEVAAVTLPSNEFTSEFISSFDVVVCAQLPIKEVLSINELTRVHKRTALYAASLNGWSGYIFVDAIQHSYPLIEDECAPRPQMLPGTRELVETDSTVCVRQTYTDLPAVVEQLRTSGLSSRLSKSELRRTPRALPFILSCWLEQEDKPKSPTSVIDTANKLSLPPPKMSRAEIEKEIAAFGVEVPAVAAVVGGFLAQDVLNYFTKKEGLIQNLAVYDAEMGSLQVYTV